MRGSTDRKTGNTRGIYPFRHPRAGGGPKTEKLDSRLRGNDVIAERIDASGMNASPTSEAKTRQKSGNTRVIYQFRHPRAGGDP